jgi:hypothetical protein
MTTEPTKSPVDTLSSDFSMQSLFSIPVTQQEQAKQEIAIQQIAEHIFNIPPESFALLPLDIRGRVILQLLPDLSTWSKEKQEKAEGYLTPTAVSNALNRNSDAEIFIPYLVTSGPGNAITLEAPGLIQEKMTMLLERIAKENPKCEKLVFKECSEISHITFLDRFSNLTHLELRGCLSLASLEGIQKCKALQTLEISTCHKLTDLNPLQGLSITHFVASDCFRLQTITGIEDSPVKYLDLSNDRGLKTLKPVKTLKQLETFIVMNLPGLKDIAQFDSLPLKHLNIYGCSVPLAQIEAFQKKHPHIQVIHNKL